MKTEHLKMHLFFLLSIQLITLYYYWHSWPVSQAHYVNPVTALYFCTCIKISKQLLHRKLIHHQFLWMTHRVAWITPQLSDQYLLPFGLTCNLTSLLLVKLVFPARQWTGSRPTNIYMLSSVAVNLQMLER